MTATPDTTTVTTFHDSVAPALIPAGGAAALYFDGLYGAAGQAAAHRFALRRWITIGADYVHCGIVDFEPGNPCFETPALLTSYLWGRAQGRHPARIYCDLSNVGRAQQHIAGAPHLWWLAAWS